MKLYLDGALVGGNAFTGGIAANDEAIVIGASNHRNRASALADLKIDNSFDGFIDEVAIFDGALNRAAIARLIAGGPQAQIDAAATGETIDGTDSYRGVEHLTFADDTRAYVLGAGSENAAALSRADVEALSGGERFVVLGDAGQSLRLVGAWGDLGAETIGETTFAAYQGGTATVLVQDGIIVTPDESLIAPVAYWNFNETSGNHVADSAGTAQDGVVFDDRYPDLDDAGPPAAVAPFGAETGIDFHGDNDDYVAVGHDAVFELADGTVQFFFNARDTHGEQGLFSKDHRGYGDGGHLDIRLDGERIEVRLQSGDTSYVIRTDRIVDDHSWNHLAFTFGADGMKLYLNGALVGENAFTGGLTANREPIVIGGSLRYNDEDRGDLGDLEVSRAFNGWMDEVAIFAQALDQARIQQLIADGPLGVTAASLAAAAAADAGDTDTGDDWLISGDDPDDWNAAGAMSEWLVSHRAPSASA